MEGRTLSLVVSLSLVTALVAVAIPAAAVCPCLIQATRNGLAGDTYVFKLNPDTGPGFYVRADSFIRITGFYGPSGSQDAAAAYVLTDFATTTAMGFTYATVVGDDDFNVELLTDLSIGQEFTLSGSLFGSTIVTFTWLSDAWFTDRDWYFVFSVPDATTINVRIDMEFNKDMTIRAEAFNGAGLLASPPDFEGTAQVSTEPYTTSVLMSAAAVAPTGARAFTMMMPIPGSFGAWVLQIDGPGATGDTAITAGNPGPESMAFVLGGGPGTYDHQVHAESSFGDPLSGHVAVFVAPPMPLPG